VPLLQLRRKEQILARIIDRVVARTDLSDVADAAYVKHLAAAFARELDDGYFQLALLKDSFDIDHAVGDDLDARAAEIQPGTLKRIQPVRAVGTVVFSRNTNPLTTVTIPSGTIVKTADNKQFKTTVQTLITGTSVEVIAGHGVGRDSPLTSTIALEPGSSGNVPSQTIKKLASKPSGVDAVLNTVSFTQGRDKELDSEFRKRLKEFVNALAKSQDLAIEFGALGITDPISGKQVQFSHLVNNILEPCRFTLYIDDGAGTAEESASVAGEGVTDGLAGPPPDSAVGGEEFLYLDNSPIRTESGLTLTSSTRGVLINLADDPINGEFALRPGNGLLFFDPSLTAAETIDADYTHFTGLIAEVQRVIDGDPADRDNYPGYRAAGSSMRVLAPVVIVPTVDVTLVLLDGFVRDDVEANVESAIIDYVNTLGISGDVIRNELIERIMEVAGVYDLVLNLPMTNTTTLDNQIPRITSANITIT
jgi:uncharacterized phage protein gp47/JayE